MLGFVVVSHSKTLAEGLLQLASQMSGDAVRIRVAAGAEEHGESLGTNALRIQQAIEEADDGEGVFVFMDLGSSLLCTETALDFLDEELRGRVELTDAPIVEGLLAAVASAGAGAPLSQVRDELRDCLKPKEDHLKDSPFSSRANDSLKPKSPPREARQSGRSPPDSGASSSESSEASFTARLRTEHGLHARPAAKVVRLSMQFNSEITLELNDRKNPKTASCRSISQLLTSGVREDEEVTFRAKGPDADRAIRALRAMVRENFGEPLLGNEPDEEEMSHPPDRHTGTDAASVPPNTLTGTRASRGHAIGPAVLLEIPKPDFHRRASGSAEEERQRLQDAFSRAEADLNALARQFGPTAQSEILEAHTTTISDPELRLQIDGRLDDGLSAEAAWSEVMHHQARQFMKMGDPYMRARARDIEDVERRVLLLLTGTETSIEFEHPGILVAHELPPSIFLQLPLTRLQGIALARGSTHDHTAILARMQGIPMVIGLGAELDRVEEGTPIGIDAERALAFIRPDEDTQRELQERVEARRRLDDDARRTGPIRLPGGREVKLVANLFTAENAQTALDFGAQGVGLLRTEFLFMGRKSPPDEAEQTEFYRRIFDTFEDRCVTIRTIDIGGDKPVPYIDVGDEPNPFLGWRGLRQSLDREGMFRTQLRAIIRAARGNHGRILLPMVSSVTEVRRARAILDQVSEEVAATDDAEEATCPPLGIMVETPAAAILAEAFLREVDFVSLGTNDLSQYTLAADRTNPRVANLVDAFDPAVLRLVQMTARAAREAGKPASACGELAGSPFAAALLVGMGVYELSMNAPSIPDVHAVVQSMELPAMEQLAADALECANAHQVHRLLEDTFRLPSGSVTAGTEPRRPSRFGLQTTGKTGDPG